MASLHQRPISAVEVGSVICTGVGLPGRAESVGRSLLENSFVKLNNRQKKNLGNTQ